MRHIADEAGKFRPGIADGLHAGFHHPVLQFGSDLRELLQRAFQLAVIAVAHNLHQLIA